MAKDDGGQLPRQPGSGRAADGPPELFYTFGNHMHWVDMEWLWGYFVLPASLRDMLRYCAETGARGNVNFDGAGYERLAVEAPDALAELREALQAGTVEVVGGSYGQPYGLFHGGESNIRHRVYGVRTSLRLLGVRPVTFWEEEFDFFPQLPQVLVGCGFRYASLFFQWTWHTPSVPKEQVPAVLWEGLDGTQILTATRNDLNLHQWPEDFDSILKSPLLDTMPSPGLVQWLELLPSHDWMCRAELIIPEMRALFSSGRFALRCVTLSTYLEQARPSAEVRRYGLQEVFHGTSLGKNGDLMRRFSRTGEDALLEAESLSVLAGFLGVPYPSWDVYPVWELEEAWRELLVGQHHDNDECEGLCGHIGMRSYERSRALVRHVTGRTLGAIARRAALPDAPPDAPPALLLSNPLGWSRSACVLHEDRYLCAPDLPAFGYRVAARAELAGVQSTLLEERADSCVLRRGGLSVIVSRASGRIVSLVAPSTGEIVAAGRPLGSLRITDSRAPDGLRVTDTEPIVLHGQAALRVRYTSATGRLDAVISLAPGEPAVDVSYTSDSVPVPDPRMQASLCAFFPVPAGVDRPEFLHDHPYGVSAISPTGRFLRKYPTGNWMTSPQVYEEVEDPFTALSFVDVGAGDRWLQVVHDGSQAQFFAAGGFWTVLTMRDPWDEEYFVRGLDCRFRLFPHCVASKLDLWKRAQEFRRGASCVEVPMAREREARAGTARAPARFEPVRCLSDGAVLTALYRETREAGAGLAGYAGDSVDYPVIVRIVEMEGRAGEAVLEIAGKLDACVRTNFMGEGQGMVATMEGQRDGVAVTRIAVPLRSHEIATLYMDPVSARRQTRNLDDYRGVWAQAHRVGFGEHRDAGGER